MDLFHLYFEMLDLRPPWFVKDILLKIDQKKVNIILNYKEGSRFPCPQCKKHTSIYDHTKQRVWRHLNTCHLKTFIHAKLPRINCATHGIQQIETNWAVKHSRFTYQMEAYITLLINNVATTNKVTEITGIGWNVVLGVKKRSQQSN